MNQINEQIAQLRQAAVERAIAKANAEKKNEAEKLEADRLQRLALISVIKQKAPYLHDAEMTFDSVTSDAMIKFEGLRAIYILVDRLVSSQGFEYKLRGDRLAFAVRNDSNLLNYFNDFGDALLAAEKQ